MNVILGTAFSAADQSLLAEIEPRSFWFNHRNEVVAAVVRRFPPAGRIFDLGGGNGYVSLGIKRAGFDCVVVEPSESGAATSAARGLPVIRGALETLPLDKLPAAGMFDVLEHIDDDTGTLTDLRRVMTRGARLYLTVPAYPLLWSSEDVVAGHFRRYRLKALCAKLRAAEFAVDYASYFFAPLVLPILAIRTLGLCSKGDARKDHAPPSGMIGTILTHALRRELTIITNGGKRAFGSSCLVAAHAE